MVMDVETSNIHGSLIRFAYVWQVLLSDVMKDAWNIQICVGIYFSLFVE